MQAPHGTWKEPALHGQQRAGGNSAKTLAAYNALRDNLVEAAKHARRLFMTHLAVQTYALVVLLGLDDRKIFEATPLRLPVINATVQAAWFLPALAALSIIVFLYWQMYMKRMWALAFEVQAESVAQSSNPEFVPTGGNYHYPWAGFFVLDGDGMLGVGRVGFEILQWLLMPTVQLVCWTRTARLGTVPGHWLESSLPYGPAFGVAFVVSATFTAYIATSQRAVRGHAHSGPTWTVVAITLVAAIAVAHLTGEKSLSSPLQLKFFRGSYRSLFALRLREADMSRAELVFTDLSLTNMNGASLAGANLRRANLRGAQLRRANLNNAVLVRSDLRGADLKQATLHDTDLSRADLRRSDLQNAHFLRATLDGTVATGVNFSGARLHNSNLHDARLSRARFMGSSLSGSSFRGATLIRAVMAGAKLDRANLQATRMDRADLTKADLRRANLSNARMPGTSLWHSDLSKADLSNADLFGAQLVDANLRNAKLMGANLRFANLKGADLRGADLRGARLAYATIIGTRFAGANLSGSRMSLAGGLSPYNLRLACGDRHTELPPGFFIRFFTNGCGANRAISW